MSFLFMFTDEHKSYGLHHEAGLVFTSANLKKLETELQGLALKYFPEQAVNGWLDLHASPMWFKKQDRKGWKTDWSKIDDFSRFCFFVDACTLINRLAQSIYVQRLRVKGGKNANFTESERLWALWFLLQKLDKKAHELERSAMLFCDEESNRKVQTEIQRQLHENVVTEKKSRYSPPITRTIAPVVFTSSTYSAGVQAADIVAYVYGRYMTNRVSAHHDSKDIALVYKTLTKLESSSIWPS